MSMSPAVVGSDHGAVLHDWIAFAVEAERLGFWSAWTTEHHFASDHSYRPFGVGAEYNPEADYDLAADPFQLLTYAAAKTERIRLGTAVAVVHWDHPLRLAERALMLDALSGGRLELGLGKGAGFREIDIFHVPEDADASSRKFTESVEIIQNAWTGERFSYEGEYFKLPPVAVLPRATQPTCPIYIGSASDSSAAWAAERGLSYATTTWPLTGLDRYKSKRSVYFEAGERAGNDVSGNLLPHFLIAYCGESDDEAQETVLRHMDQYQYILEQHYEFGRQGDALKRLFGAQQDEMQRVRELSLHPIEHQIVGSVETVRQRVEMFRQEIGLNYLVLQVKFGLLPQDKMFASMRRFAEEVMPYFVEHDASSAATASTSLS
jgi:alkanesulfonate monooxygenase SsuD/methylene tetrahydromethanopterin reductase-like flavin-dependent oxidoreductase (luciferase family)